MKKLTIEIVELPDNDGYEARIPELGEAVYRGWGNSEKEALESLGLVMSDIEAKRTCKNCSFWLRVDENMGKCEMLANSKDESIRTFASTEKDFWCCRFKERLGE